MQTFELILLSFLIICALAVSLSRNLLVSLIIFMSYSLVMSILWIVLQSPDLAITEAAVGAGVTSIIFFVTLYKIKGLREFNSAPQEAIEEETTEVVEETVVTTKKHHEKTINERLQEWIAKYEMPLYKRFYNVMAVVLSTVIILCMLLTVSELPSYGDPSNPANNEVSEKYIMDTMEDTGAVNIVAGMILDYRAFDTFGESTVLFVAAGTVIILLRNDRKKKEKEENDRMYEPKPDIILQNIAKLLVPVALMFGIYVVLNGHLSPGGGFSGGAIMGAALILYYNAFGAENCKKFFTYRTFNTIIVCALSFYAVAKSYSFYTGANHIHSIIPKGTPGNILSSGLILPLNIAVGVIVMCTMFGFYSLFHKEEI
ncbi:MAG: DUF4040 domain-containing protein [Erysipelotrichaceae bacterium]|nr:DUF4040 domain-containing protein [Erysipelotrichaceae bacterium]